MRGEATGRHRRLVAGALLGALALVAPALALSKTTQLGTTKGLAYASNEITADPISGWHAKATCPGAKRAVGGGAFVGGSPATGFLTASYPFGREHRAWAARGYNGSGADAGVTVYAICGRSKLGISYARKSWSIEAAPAGFSAAAKCPSGVADGGGVRVRGPAHGASINTSSAFDGPDQDTYIDDGWRSFVGNSAGGKRKFTVYAICLTHSSGTTGSADTVPAAPGVLSASDDCYLGPFTDNPTIEDAGIFVSGTILGSHIHYSAPHDGPDANAKPDDGWSYNISNDAGAEKQFTLTMYCR